MRILALGDLHGKLPKRIKSIIKKNNVELVVCVGEIPNVPFFRRKDESWEDYRNRFNKHYSKILTELNSLNAPVFVLKGNENGKGTRKLIKKFGNVKHKYIGKEIINRKSFIFFDMIWEKWAYSYLPQSFLNIKAKSIPYRKRKLNELLEKDKDCILVSHAPPYGYLDVVKNEVTNFKRKHVGSKILLSAIKKHQPRIVFCGHIHEAQGKAKIGKTEVYNLGERRYIVMDLEKNKILESNFLK